MHDGLRLAAKNRVGKSMAFADGNRRQGDPVGDIANGNRSTSIFDLEASDLHRAKTIAGDASLFKPSPLVFGRLPVAIITCSDRATRLVKLTW